MTQNGNKAMTLYVSNVRGRKTNTSYPYKAVITCTEDLARAAAYDHVSAEYRDGKNRKGNIIVKHRSKDTFVEADNLNMDNDNTQNNPMLPDIPPEQWKTPEDVQAAFPGVAFYAVPSQNHMKEKDGLPARPKWHYYFLLKNKITDPVKWAAMKQKVREIFPAFDDNALDAARFLYGVENPQPVYYDGELCIDEYLENLAWNAESEKAVHTAAPAKKTAFPAVIPVGQRNNTLSRFASTVLTKYGAEDGKAYRAFLEYADKCEQPLENTELQTIWNSAESHYYRHTSRQPGYVAPADYAAQDFTDDLIPTDFTDVGQANLLAAVYGGRMKYTPATKWLVYNGKVWQENELTAQGLVQELTERQLQLARKLLQTAQAAENEAAEKQDMDAEEKAKDAEDFAKSFRAFVLGERKSTRIAAALREAMPKLQVPVEELDKDPFLLNTPGGTVDLRTGKMRPHDPNDYCTQITAVTPGTEGAELFAETLRRISCNDPDLARYHQDIAGMCLVGHVFEERLITAYGTGGNGKSTLYNLQYRCLGSYAGMVSSEVLITSNKNKQPEIAELRGKRLIIAAELEEGRRLDTAAVKHLCSTDPIRGEKKYKDPFDFVPSHTVVLYTNHLPKVSTIDKGTWDRLVVVPFNANLRGMKSEIKNYAEYLFDHAGGAVLSWMIEGARRFIANNFTIDPPECVKRATAEYRASNDWLNNFLTECCEQSPNYSVMSSDLYNRYREYCDAVLDYTRNPTDFKKAMEQAGFDYKRTSRGQQVRGIALKTLDFQEVDERTPWDEVMPLTG